MRSVKSISKSGFTLVELLLGVAIFSIIALTVYSVFFAALKVQRHSIRHEEMVYQMSLALESMARDLENAVGYNFANSYPKIKAFDGSGDKITFIQSSADGLRFVSYYIEKAEQGERHTVKIGEHSDKNVTVTEERSQREDVYQLIRKTQPLVDGLNVSDQNTETRIVCRHVKPGGLKFAFGSVNPDSRERFWQSAWSFNVIPALVRIDLSASSTERTVELRKDVLNPSGTMIVQ